MDNFGKENEPRVRISESDLPQTFTVKLLGRKDASGLWGIKNTRQPVDSLIAAAKTQNLSLPIVHIQVSKEGVLICKLGCNLQSSTKDSENEVDINSNLVPKNIQKTVPKTIFRGLKHSVFGFRSKKSSCENLIKKNFAKTPEIHQMKKMETDFALMERLNNESSSTSGRTFIGIDRISYGVQDLVFTRVFCMIVVSESQHENPFQCYAFICEDRNVARAVTYSLSAAFQVYSRTIKARRPVIHPVKETDRRAKILAIDLRTPEQKNEDQRRLLDSEA